MATKYFCDRCNKEAITPFEKVIIPKPEHNNRYKRNRNLDLCNHCIAGLNEWAEPVPIDVAKLNPK